MMVDGSGCCIMRCGVCAPLWLGRRCQGHQRQLCVTVTWRRERATLPPSASVGISLRNFPWEQMYDESLKHVFDQVKATYDIQNNTEIAFTCKLFSHRG